LRCARRRAGEGLIAGCLSLLTRRAYSHKSRARANLRGDAVPRAVPYQGTAGRPSGPPVRRISRNRDACQLFAQLERAAEGGRLLATFRLNELSGARITRTLHSSPRNERTRPRFEAPSERYRAFCDPRRRYSPDRLPAALVGAFWGQPWNGHDGGAKLDGGGTSGKDEAMQRSFHWGLHFNGRVGRAWALIGARRT
jgi:hypothetical protein